MSLCWDNVEEKALVRAELVVVAIKKIKVALDCLIATQYKQKSRHTCIGDYYSSILVITYLSNCHQHVE